MLNHRISTRRTREPNRYYMSVENYILPTDQKTLEPVYNLLKNVKGIRPISGIGMRIEPNSFYLIFSSLTSEEEKQKAIEEATVIVDSWLTERDNKARKPRRRRLD